MERNNSVIIIGAGLGGLECGYILARNGMKVTVLEHNAQIGGCIQSFKRGTATFDTGFHYIGGLGEGESLNPLFRYLNLMELPWKKLDEDCFDEVFIGEKSYPFANGHRHFVERLSEYFPDQKSNLESYVSFLKKVGDHIFDAFEPRDSMDFYSTSLFARSAYEYLQETITDPLLRKVLAGTSLKMELKQDTLPLYIFAQINNSFIQSAWRLEGGGKRIAEHLAEDIRRMGGEIITSATVTELIEEEGRVSSVVVNGGEVSYSADWVISSAHPSRTLDLVRESKVLKRIYRKRVANLKNTMGMFTANIRLKKDSLPYLNRNLFLHAEDADLWNPDLSRLQSMLVSYGVPVHGGAAETIDLLCPMSWSDVEKWADQPFGKRDEEYKAMKERKAAECLRIADQYIPGLSVSVDRIFTSTPLTYSNYTLTPEGTAYGIRKDFENTMTTIMAPKTPLENLLLTGQNLNLHGILGVSMTSVITTAMILGMDVVKNDIFRK